MFALRRVETEQGVDVFVGLDGLAVHFDDPPLVVGNGGEDRRPVFRDGDGSRETVLFERGQADPAGLQFGYRVAVGDLVEEVEVGRNGVVDIDPSVVVRDIDREDGRLVRGKNAEVDKPVGAAREHPGAPLTVEVVVAGTLPFGGEEGEDLVHPVPRELVGQVAGFLLVLFGVATVSRDRIGARGCGP